MKVSFFVVLVVLIFGVTSLPSTALMAATSAPGTRPEVMPVMESSDSSPQPILIAPDSHALGCILPLSGRFADYGKRALKTLILAGGFFDHTRRSNITLLIEDSHSRPEIARAAVEKLVRNGAIAIIGPLSSDEAKEAVAEAERLKVPLLSLTQAEGITDAGNFIFRNFLTAASQIESLVKFAMDEMQLRKFAVLYPDDSYGQDIMTRFYLEVKKRNGKIVWADTYNPDQDKFKESIDKLTLMTGTALPGDKAPGSGMPGSYDFEALFIPASTPALLKIIPELASHGIPGSCLLGLNSWNSRELLAPWGNYLDGSVFTDGFHEAGDSPEVIEFVGKFRKAYGAAPDVMEAEIYDTAEMALRILQGNTDLTRDTFRQALLSLNAYPGVTGKTSFMGTRDARKDAVILMVDERKVIQLQ